MRSLGSYHIQSSLTVYPLSSSYDATKVYSLSSGPSFFSFPIERCFCVLGSYAINLISHLTSRVSFSLAMASFEESLSIGSALTFNKAIAGPAAAKRTPNRKQLAVRPFNHPGVSAGFSVTILARAVIPPISNKNPNADKVIAALLRESKSSSFDSSSNIIALSARLLRPSDCRFDLGLAIARR
jgi:hypothetical protein